MPVKHPLQGLPASPPQTKVSLLIHGTPTIFDSSFNNATLSYPNAASIQNNPDASGANQNEKAIKFEFQLGYVQTPTNTDLYAMGTGDYTVEGWFYPTSTGGQVLCSTTQTGGGATNGFYIGTNYSSGPDMDFTLWEKGASTYAFITVTSVLKLNQWSHIAMCRSGTTVRGFINGVSDFGGGKVAQFTSPGPLNLANGVFGLGRLNEPAANYTGYASEVRLTKGLALYTEAFNPPRCPLPNP